MGSTSEMVRNIILVGRTGNGKSASGNSILGKQDFTSRTDPAGVTMECQKSQVKTPSGLIINVIDTPGLFDNSASFEYLSREMVKCLELAEGGIHALVLVLSLRTRITQEEEHTLAMLQRLFGGKILDYLVVLFTGADELEANQLTLDDYLCGGCPEFLMGVLRLCGGRKVLFNNRTTNESKKKEQVRQLLVRIQEIYNNNDGKPFKHAMHLQIEENRERVWEQRKVIESQDLGKRESSEMKKRLEMMYEHNMKEMTEMLEKRLQEVSVVNERTILTLKGNLDKAVRENEALRNGQEHTRVKLDISVPSVNPPSLSVIYICFLLFGVVYCVFSYT